MLGYSSLSKIYMLEYIHWRRSALNSAGALQVKGGEFRGIFTPFYTINFRGLCKTGGARAPAAPPSSAPMHIYIEIVDNASLQADTLKTITGTFSPILKHYDFP